MSWLLRVKNGEKSKTTARLTQRNILKTIFQLAKPAFFRYRCYFSGSLQGYQVSKITDLRDNSDRRYCEKTQFNIRGLRAPETVPYLALLPSRKVIPGFRISGS